VFRAEDHEGKLLPEHRHIFAATALYIPTGNLLDKDSFILKKNILQGYINILWGHAVAQLVEALRYKPEDRGFDFQWCHGEFFFDIIFPVTLWPWC